MDSWITSLVPPLLGLAAFILIFSGNYKRRRRADRILDMVMDSDEIVMRRTRTTSIWVGKRISRIKGQGFWAMSEDMIAFSIYSPHLQFFELPLQNVVNVYTDTSTRNRWLFLGKALVILEYVDENGISDFCWWTEKDPDRVRIDLTKALGAVAQPWMVEQLDQVDRSVQN